ncbi:hypothetical protein P691DRAFT_683292 [Macrolepiota fuliginosa MF-IS2]|uniref:Uncharacterized protein n=1 Tax=Macrolepiota fuliginosa MF-IS2 TaxID=1400762 RepID=A0A9P5X1H8_9AGAR|nr:hypothetical protein P691DRAFT_683292 [Macrolepiota fuliginosa MF-IS2]
MCSPFRSLAPSLILTNLTILSLHFLGGLSLKQSNFLLCALGLQSQIATAHSEDSDLRPLPLQAHAIIDQMDLSPQYMSYACCPKCFHLYDLEGPYPAACTHRTASSSGFCGTTLCPTGSQKPLNQYDAYDFKVWLAQVYAQPEIEILLGQQAAALTKSQVMCDVWDSDAIRTLRGPDGKFFLNCPQGESHLVFSLNMGWFNPPTSKHSNKQVSFDVIYMTCLNLPTSLRYQPENVFLVGVIPGPHEYSTTQMNNLLCPFVQILTELWDTGLFLERTPKYLFGH